MLTTGHFSQSGTTARPVWFRAGLTGTACTQLALFSALPLELTLFLACFQMTLISKPSSRGMVGFQLLGPACPGIVNCVSKTRAARVKEGTSAFLPYALAIARKLASTLCGLSNSCRYFHALCAMLVTSHAQTKILLHSSGPHRRIRREAIKDAGKLTLAVASDQVSSLTQASPATQEKLAISVNSLGVGFGTANSRKQVSLL